MKAYVIRPTMDVFDGSGTLGPAAEKALRVIAEMVVQALLQGGDTRHRAVIREGPCDVDTPPTIIAECDSFSLAALVRRLLDPNSLAGGGIRSAVNCRAATFGQDGQAFLCLRHEDAAPSSPEPTLATVAEEAIWLANTDVFDGGWPTQC